jgi:hypothetical protein
MNATIDAIDRRYIVNRQGKELILFAGLLDLAHRSGLKRITTQLLQAPDETNGQCCICRAEVETDNGTFTGIGDATPLNVGKSIVPHLIRMAETRSKARALRDALNVGGVSLEELGPELDQGREERRRSA